MKSLLWLIPTLPLVGAILLVLTRGRLSKSVAGLIGAGSVGLSALITILIGFDFMSAPEAYQQVLWTWIACIQSWHIHSPPDADQA
jgi:NADH-quinone oxidoreductase subunit L